MTKIRRVLIRSALVVGLVLIVLQGGADRVVPPGSGQKRLAAAKEPRQIWFEPAVGHTQFLRARPDEFEQRIVGFFDAPLKQRLPTIPLKIQFPFSFWPLA